MIVAAGLSPAWQQIVLLEQLHPGEVNRARQVQWCASGKVINVGLALGCLGAESTTIALVGGVSGTSIADEFAQRTLTAQWVRSAAPTRVCTTILETETGIATELVENSAPATEQELNEFAHQFAAVAKNAQTVVLAGSLPAGSPESYYKSLMANLDCQVIIDGRGAELRAALEAKPLLVKPNRQELARTIGREISTDEELVTAMRELNRHGAQWVLVTQGAAAVWLSSRQDCYRFLPPRITPVNPIGSGDSLAAGIAWALASDDDMLRAVRIGIAAGVENALQLLPARLDPDLVLRRAESVTTDRIH